MPLLAYAGYTRGGRGSATPPTTPKKEASSKMSCPGSPRMTSRGSRAGPPSQQQHHSGGSMSMPRRLMTRSSQQQQQTGDGGSRRSTHMSRSQEDRSRKQQQGKPPWNSGRTQPYATTTAGGHPQMTTSNGMMFVGIAGGSGTADAKCESLPASPRRYIAKYTTATASTSKVSYHKPGSISKVAIIRAY